MLFTIETKQSNKMSLLDVNVIREQGKFITNVYQKPAFIGAYTHFNRFLPDTYKIGVIRTLVNRRFRICCSYSMLNQQLILLR